MAETGRRLQENYIYWGSSDGFSPARRSALMGKGTRGVSIADLDRDGYLDVIFLNTGLSAEDKNLDAYIYWGGPSGFVTTQRTEIPSGGSGLPLAADFNSDGHLDLVFARGKDDVQILWGRRQTRNYTAARASNRSGKQRNQQYRSCGYESRRIARPPFDQTWQRSFVCVFWRRQRGLLG